MTSEDPSVMDRPADLPFPPELARVQGPAIVAAIAGLVLMIIGFLWDTPQASKAYLFAWLFCFGLSLGGLAILMLGHLVTGEWAWILRRFGEAAAANLPLLAVLFIPIACTFKLMYPWAVPSIVEHDKILTHRAPYMNIHWVIIRAIIYFAIWISLSTGLRSCTLNFDRTGDRKFLARAGKISAAGMPLYFVTLTLAAVDWIMTLDAHWFSHILGFVTAIGQAGSAVALMAFLIGKAADREPLKRYLQPRHLNDIGNLMLALTILWAYMSFSQLLIIWMGNTQDDNMYYVQRGFGMYANAWRWVGLLLLIFHFFVPFFILLIRNNKRKARTLGRIGLGLIIMRCVDVYWWVVPTPTPSITHPKDGMGGRGSWLDPCAVALLVGVWMTVYIWQLKQRPLLARLGIPLTVDRAHGAHGHDSHGTEHALERTPNPSLA